MGPLRPREQLNRAGPVGEGHKGELAHLPPEHYAPGNGNGFSGPLVRWQRGKSLLELARLRGDIDLVREIFSHWPGCDGIWCVSRAV